MWKETYPALLGETLEIEILHSTTWTETLISKGRLHIKRTRPHGTFHDPADLGRGSGIFEAPRRRFTGCSGTKTGGDAAQPGTCLCCGGGGDVEMVEGS